MAKKRKKDFYDDGRVIAPMGDVRNPHPFTLLPPRLWDERRTRKASADDQTFVAQAEREPLSKRELRIIASSVLWANLSVAAVIVVIFAVLFLFCRYCWLRY